MDRTTAVVRTIGWRLGAQALLESAVLWLSLGLGAAAVLVLAERLLSLGASVLFLAAVPIAAACTLAAARGLVRWPDSATAALRADARLGLAERLSSSLAAGHGPMSDLLRRDATRHAEAIEPRESFPVRLPPRARAVAPLAVALAVALLLPPLDLLGWGAAREARARAVGEATRDAHDALGAISRSAREQGLSRPAEAVARVQAALASPDDAEARAQAELDAAMDANAAARGASAADPRALAQLDREDDVLRRAARELERWRRRLAAARAAAAMGAGSDTAAGAGRQFRFVRSDPSATHGPDAKTPETRPLAARPAATAAMTHDSVPWRYRVVVQRYFSTDKPPGGPER